MTFFSRLRVPLLSLLLMFWGLSAMAFADLRDVSGYISIENGYYHIIENSSAERVRLVPLTATVKSALSKLKTHDYVMGSAELVGESYILHSVDSVGLRRLLGVWQAGNTVVEFESFRSLRLFHETTTQFTYTLTPDSEQSWNVFLTNEHSVTLGALHLNSSTQPSEMVFELFDSTSGSTTKKVILKKVRK